MAKQIIDQEEGNSLLERAYAADAEDAIDGPDVCIGEVPGHIIVQEGLRDQPFRVNAGSYRMTVSGNVHMREHIYVVSEGFDTLQEALKRLNECKQFDGKYEWFELQWVNPDSGAAYDVVLNPVLDFDDEDDIEEDEEAENDAARQYGEDHENHGR